MQPRKAQARRASKIKNTTEINLLDGVNIIEK